MVMKISIVALLLSFLLYSSPPIAAGNDNILLDCGSSSNQTSIDLRAWQTDSLSVFIPSNADQISEPSSAEDHQDPSVNGQTPYMTARIIHSEFTFTFPSLSVGSKFLRLYFYPASYTNKNNQIFNKTEPFFSVKANQYTLLQNFSALLNLPKKENQQTLIKEYIIHINEDNQQLNLTFLPSEKSFSFVNGIEIISIPDKLYHRGDNVPIPFGTESNQPYHLKNGTALETMYRLNVGGLFIATTDDTGMFRKWEIDDDYLFRNAKGMSTADKDAPVTYTSSAPNYTAPKLVYTSARFMDDKYSLVTNLTWLFPVDSGNYYLLRLHFCEFFFNIQKYNERVFSIFINNKTAEEHADVIEWGGLQPKVAVFKDYVVFVSDIDGQKSKQDIWLSMHPNMDRQPAFANVLLNGLEIFKLSLPNTNSLAAPNPPPSVEAAEPAVQPPNPDKKKTMKIWPVIAAVCVGAAALVMVILGFVIFRRRQRGEHSAYDDKKSSSSVPLADKSKSSKNSVSGSSLPDNSCRKFSIEEILSATGNFHENFLIGVGGFGNVYKGSINYGEKIVAIKRLNPSSDQGEIEFLTEINMLSELRHLNLVPLIGYCVDHGEMILVYDYMARGNLREHLYKSENSILPWKQRLQICIGAAKGLDYLHTGAKHTIIHRDVKSTNILLDEKWVAKVSDFGLSKMGPTDGDKTHVSTAVKGSFGYVDPEYYRRKQLTEKSDVYSFGVVLFEVLCGRPAVIPFNSTMAKEEVNLATWAHFCNKKGTIDQIVDPIVKGEIAVESLNRFVETALKCLNKVGTERPTMNDVVWSLQFALELQDSSEKERNEDDPSAPLVLQATSEDNTDIFSRSLELASSFARSNSSDDFTASGDEFKSHNVFSEIMKPSAR